MVEVAIAMGLFAVYATVLQDSCFHKHGKMFFKQHDQCPRVVFPVVCVRCVTTLHSTDNTHADRTDHVCWNWVYMSSVLDLARSLLGSRHSLQPWATAGLTVRPSQLQP